MITRWSQVRVRIGEFFFFFYGRQEITLLSTYYHTMHYISSSKHNPHRLPNPPALPLSFPPSSPRLPKKLISSRASSNVCCANCAKVVRRFGLCLCAKCIIIAVSVMCVFARVRSARHRSRASCATWAS